jgi:hypothetical protein
MALTLSQFLDKWTKQKWIPANYDDIDDSYFREFTEDIAAVFGVEAVNVPAYDPKADYPRYYVVRYRPAGEPESFYYSLEAGTLPPPGATTNAYWQIVPGPTKATDLSQTITLPQAQGLQGRLVVPGRTYLIAFGPNANGDPQTITVRGIANSVFDTDATLDVLGVLTPITALDVVAGTYQLRGTSGGTTPSPSPATFGNLGGLAKDNKSLVNYVASLGHALTEYVPPMVVQQGFWYIAPTGIWEAKSSFTGSAAPLPGAYWRLVVAFGTTSPGSQLGGAAITALAATTFNAEVAPSLPVDTGRYRLRAIPKSTSGGGGTTTPPTQPPAPSGFTVDSERLGAFTPNAGTVLSEYEYELTEQA